MAYQPGERERRSAAPPEQGSPLWAVILMIVLGIAGLAGESLLAVTLIAVTGVSYLLFALVRLQRRSDELQAQVAWLMARQSVAGPDPVPPAADEAQASGAARPAVPAAPAPVPTHVPTPVPTAGVKQPAPAPPPVVVAAQAPAEREPFDWEGTWRTLAGPIAGVGRGPSGVDAVEARIGTVWLSRIGMLVILISAIVGYTLLESSLLQAAIGWAAGLGLLGLGRWGYRKGYGPWSQAVTGGGIGLLYLVTTAAATVFRQPVLPVAAAFGLMILITVLGTWLAIFHDAIAVGVLAMVGGFATPFLLSTGEGSFQVLFTYVAILDLGLLGVAWFKRWPLYNYLLFAATWAIYGAWRGAAYTPADSGWAFLFATVFFVIFAGVSIQYNILHRQKSRYQDLGVVLANGFLFFSSGLELLPEGAARAGFAFAMALAHLGLGWLTLRRNPVDRLIQLTFLSLGGIFLTIAFPVALSGPWLTVAWALEAASLVWVSFLVDEPWARYGGLAVFTLAAGRLMLWETFPGLFDLAMPGLVLRAFTFGMTVMALYLGVWAYARFRGERLPMAALAVAANLFTLWYITLEIALAYDGAHNGRVAGHEAMAIAGAWGLYGLLIALAERRFRHEHVRNGARAVLAAALVYLMVGALMANGRWALPGYRFFAYTGVLGSIWLAEWLFRDRSAQEDIQGLLSLAAALMGFIVGAFEVVRWLEPAFTLPNGTARTLAWRNWRDSTQLFWTLAVWGGYGVLVMGAGAWLRSSRTRLLATAMLAATLFYALIEGLPNLAAAPGLRLLAFLMIVPGTYGAAYLAWRSGGEHLAYEGLAVRWTALGAAVLTAAWGVYELADALPAWAGPHAGLAWVGLYGLAVTGAGLWLRSRETRLIGLGMAALGALAAPLILMAEHQAPWLLQGAGYLATVGGIYGSAWLVRRHRERTGPYDMPATEWAALGAAAWSLVWLWLEVGYLTQGNVTVRDFLVSAVVGGYGFLVLAAGFLLRHRRTRLLALGIVGLVMLKMVAWDMWNLAFIWRFWITLGIGSLMVIASLAYQRYGKRILQD